LESRRALLVVGNWGFWEYRENEEGRRKETALGFDGRSRTASWSGIVPQIFF